MLSTTPDSLGFYFKVYDSLIACNATYVLRIEDPESGNLHPITHDNILLVAGILRCDPTLTLLETTSQLSAKLGYGCARKQLETSVFISVQAMFMLDCAGLPDPWQPGEPFVNFVSRCFLREAGVNAPVRKAIECQNAIKAWKLRARCHISFRGTDDLTCHLLLDRQHLEGLTLYIFHYTAFLKAQLELVKQGGFKKEDGVKGYLRRLQAPLLHIPPLNKWY